MDSPHKAPVMRKKFPLDDGLTAWKAMLFLFTLWGRVTHICVSKLTIIASDNGLSSGLLVIGPLGTNFNEISIEIDTFLFKKMHLKMSSGKWRPFCRGFNVLNPLKDPCEKCACICICVALYLLVNKLLSYVILMYTWCGHTARPHIADDIFNCMFFMKCLCFDPNFTDTCC